jgi:hypothetical protein
LFLPLIDKIRLRSTDGEVDRMSPDARIINLETAVTKSEDYDDKGFNYRMHPENIPCQSGLRAGQTLAEGYPELGLGNDNILTLRWN